MRNGQSQKSSILIKSQKPHNTGLLSGSVPKSSVKIQLILRMPIYKNFVSWYYIVS
nr:MAG TPA: hypothetical protein [Caudoviricetes sp.]